jgi:hypothetical protein
MTRGFASPALARFVLLEADYLIEATTRTVRQSNEWSHLLDKQVGSAGRS